MSLRILTPYRPVGLLTLAVATWRCLQRVRARARVRDDLAAMPSRDRLDAGLSSGPIWRDDYQPPVRDGE